MGLRGAIAMLEQQMIDVDGATLEVFLGGSDEPAVCVSHPFGLVKEQLPVLMVV
jgi:hypothetical protein